MRKFPTKLKIGGHTVTVELCDLNNNDGEWSSKNNRIRIEKSLPSNQRDATLLHEILHALNATFDENHVGHMLLESLSQQLYQVLSDNKLLK